MSSHLLALFPFALQLFLGVLISAPGAHAQLVTACTQPGTVALTFDDGPYDYLRDFVDLLDRNDAKGTFFFNGDNYDCIYSDKRAKDIKYAYDKGHQIGSHTWRHADLSTIKNETKLNDEFQRTEDAIKKILGVEVAMTRPPYGAYSDLTQTVARKRGQSLILWDLDTRDADGATTNYSITQYENAVKKSPSTILALNHEPYDTTLNTVIPRALELLKGKYKFVTVAQCLGLEPYKSIGTPSQRDSSWKC